MRECAPVQPDQPPKTTKARKKDKAPTDWVPVQFDIPPDDDADFMDLVDELKNRTTVGRILFYYGLNNSTAAFGAYAAPREERRKKRLKAKAETDVQVQPSLGEPPPSEAPPGEEPSV